MALWVFIGEQALATKTRTEDAQRPQLVLVDGMPLVCVCNANGTAKPILHSLERCAVFVLVWFRLGEPGMAS